MKILDPNNKIDEFLKKIPSNEEYSSPLNLDELFDFPEPKSKVIRFFRNKEGLHGYNLGYTVTHPIEMIRYSLKDAKYAFQRIIRGWDYSQTWGIDYAYSKILGELILEFKRVNNGVPTSIIAQVYGEEWNGNETPEQFNDACKLWDEILEEMAEGFLFYHNYKYDTFEDKDFGILNKKINRSLELFSKHFQDLWW